MGTGGAGVAMAVMQVATVGGVVGLVCLAGVLGWWVKDRNQPLEGELVPMVQCRVLPEEVEVRGLGGDNPDEADEGDAAQLLDGLQRSRVWMDCPALKGNIDYMRRRYPHVEYRLVGVPYDGQG